MKHALFAGTFDPPTLGHINIIERAAQLCEQLSVGVAVNTRKSNGLLPSADRLELLQELCKPLSNVTVLPVPGLVMEFVKKEKVDLLIRALRTDGDFESELAMALANRQLAGVETIFLFADPRYAHISSTLVREIAHFGGSLEFFVPSSVELKILSSKNS